MAHFGLHEDLRTLLVFGGSLLASALSEVLEPLADDLAAVAADWQLLHITGSPRADQIDRTLKARGLSIRTQGYCDRMDLAYAAADLVLARAGAVTVAELAATGTPAVLMPYPHHADRHQYLNAAALAQTGSAVLCEDFKNSDANAWQLRQVLLPLMGDRAALEAMRQAAAKQSDQLYAARDVAGWLLDPLS